MAGYYYSNDFCADMKKWTTLILSTDDGPSVHSVSYGYQGNISAYCTVPDELTDIARQDSAEDFPRLNVQRCTAMGCILIPAYCSAHP